MCPLCMTSLGWIVGSTAAAAAPLAAITVAVKARRKKKKLNAKKGDIGHG